MMPDIASTIRLRCPDCLAVFRSAFTFCPADGATLIQCVEEPLLGATIADRYVLQDLIGEGAMGLVYRASHVRLPRPFAIKVLFGDMASDARMRLRFAQEASAACRLSHPNVVTVVDFGKSERGLLYLVMDYVDGETLSELITREAPLSERRVIELARQLCEGLGHAHGQGVVHRDFKPDNVVLEPRDGGSPVPRILDFGLAITANDDDTFDGRLTQHGWVVGTPAYLSPEQARDEEVDQRADLYALGVVMYEMLAGVAPFEGNAMEVAHRNMLEPVPPIRTRNPDVHVSAELERVVRRLLEKKADDRFATADEVIAALDYIDETFDYGISEGMAALVLGDPPPVAVAEPFLPFEVNRPHRLRRAALGLTVVAAVAGLLYLVTGGDASFVGTAEVAAHTVEPAPAETAVSLADLPSAPAESPAVQSPAAPEAPAPAVVAPEPPVAAVAAPEPEAAKPSPMATRARPATPRRAHPAGAPRGTAAPPRRPVARRDRPVTLPNAGVADPETPAHLAAATVPPPRPAPDLSVSRLIDEYRQVGQAIARLHGQGDPDAASGFRDRYFQLPYADALRIPSVRRDTLAQLAALRRDLAAAR